MIMCYISLNFGILKGQMDVGLAGGLAQVNAFGLNVAIAVFLKYLSPVTYILVGRLGWFLSTPGWEPWDEDGGRGQRYHEIYPNKRLDIEIFVHI